MTALGIEAVAANLTESAPFDWGGQRCFLGMR